jgi:hypothetical protein
MLNDMVGCYVPHCGGCDAGRRRRMRSSIQSLDAGSLCSVHIVCVMITGGYTLCGIGSIAWLARYRLERGE